MEGYFVITKDSETEESKRIREFLKNTKLVDLQCTRAFNRVTGGVYKKSAESAVTHLRNNQEEARKRRKEYHSKPEIKQKMKEYNQRPEVKEKKRKDRLRKQKLLASLPPEIIAKAYKDE